MSQVIFNVDKELIMASGWEIAGAILNPIGSLINAGMSSYNTRKMNQSNERIAAQNRQLQREFAQNSIQWKVNDAKQAGLHPLAAIGAQGTSYTPVHQDVQTPRFNLDFSQTASILANMENQQANTDLQEAQTDYWRAMAKEVKDRNKAMEGQNSQQMTGLYTGQPINGTILGKSTNTGKNAVVTNSAEDFTNLVPHMFDSSKFSLFPRGISKPSDISQYLTEYATDGNLNLFGKISQWFNSLTPLQREYFVVDKLRSLGPTLELIDTRDKYAMDAMTEFLIRLNLALDDNIPFMKYFWRK